VVDISDQRVYAYEGSQLIFNYPASTGENNSTLTGQFSILDKEPDAYSDPWGFWMPDWMGIYYASEDLENGFHSLPVLPNGSTLWGNLIGTPITYGCVVLEPGDMQALYQWANIGTPVTIRP
jgi:lipoprotein-anchoring transpeptidase ErfK/SrfK